MTVFRWTDLSIASVPGSAWRPRPHNLMVYTCEGKHYLTWIVCTGRRCFKMKVPYKHIVNMCFANMAPSGLSSRIGITRR